MELRDAFAPVAETAETRARSKLRKPNGCAQRSRGSALPVAAPVEGKGHKVAADSLPPWLELFPVQRDRSEGVPHFAGSFARARPCADARRKPVHMIAIEKQPIALDRLVYQLGL